VGNKGLAVADCDANVRYGSLNDEQQAARLTEIALMKLSRRMISILSGR
jgi:hypothetical protein